MKITALTATGDRRLCLDLLTKWIGHQTLKPTQWLIIDDGKNPYMPDADCDYVYRKPQSVEPRHTLMLNLEVALKFIEGDIVLFMEDDEYYAPDYVKTMADRLEGYELVGICKSKYYHIPAKKYFVHPNQDHASLAQTGMVKEYLPRFKTLLEGDSFIDLRMWCDIANKTRVENYYRNTPMNPNGVVIGNKRGYLFDDGLKDCLYVGIKGMPGRAGIGSGHRCFPGTLDPNCETLKKWMPKDYKTYTDLNLNVTAPRSEKRIGRRFLNEVRFD
jgi:hypothetical protein